MRKRSFTLALLLSAALHLLPSFGFSQPCQGTSIGTNLDVNNVKAHITQGGNLWRQGQNGQYIVPKDGQTSALFTGSLWMAGRDADGALHLAAQTYSNDEYSAGPLDEAGTTNFLHCLRWNRLFEVSRADVDAHRADWIDNQSIDGPIPESILGWPGAGNPHFPEVHNFELPVNTVGLAPFYDRDEDGAYDPENGDFPLSKGDHSIWWVYNDDGGGRAPGVPGSLPVKMEVQANAFAFGSGPGAAENTTFYDFRLIYKGEDTLSDFWLSLWVDPDLGCHTDDFVGCAPEESLAYVYNGDAEDENCSGLTGYGADIPILGIKVLRPYAPGGAENTGMSRFMYYNYGASGIATPPAAQDPISVDPQSYYNYMQGLWRDGAPLSQGGSGYEPGAEPYPYAFDGNPADESAWSECSAGITPNDIRLLLSFGPYMLKPGDIGELSFAVVWLPSQPYPCPDVSALIAAANEMDSLYQAHSEEVMVSAVDLAAAGMIQLFPNPAGNRVTFQVAARGLELRSVQLFAAKGNLVRQSGALSGQQATLPLDNLPGGLYFYRALLSNGKVAVGRLVKQ